MGLFIQRLCTGRVPAFRRLQTRLATVRKVHPRIGTDV